MRFNLGPFSALYARACPNAAWLVYSSSTPREALDSSVVLDLKALRGSQVTSAWGDEAAAGMLLRLTD